MQSYEFDVNQLRGLPIGNKNIKTIYEKKGGWDSRFFILNDEIVVKVPRDINAQRSIKKEKIVTHLLRKELPLPVPEMTLAEIDSVNGEKLEIVFYEMLPGIELQNTHMIDDRDHTIAKSLGLFLKQLHNIPEEMVQTITSRISGIQNERNESDSELLESVLEYFREMKHEKNVSSYIEIMEESLSQLKDMDWKIVPSHGDFMSNNIIYNESRDKISGIIDWGDFSFRDPTYDFAGLAYEFGEQFLDYMLTAYSFHVPGYFKYNIMNLSKFVPFNTVYFSRNMERRVRFENKYIELELAESGRNLILHVG